MQVETTVRLQSASITAAKGGNTLLSLTYGYGSTNNHGNVRSQTIAPLGVTQSYDYDQLNRLKWFASDEVRDSSTTLASSLTGGVQGCEPVAGWSGLSTGVV